MLPNLHVVIEPKGKRKKKKRRPTKTKTKTKTKLILINPCQKSTIEKLKIADEVPRKLHICEKRRIFNNVT